MGSYGPFSQCKGKANSSGLVLLSPSTEKEAQKKPKLVHKNITINTWCAWRFSWFEEIEWMYVSPSCRRRWKNTTSFHGRHSPNLQSISSTPSSTNEKGSGVLPTRNHKNKLVESKKRENWAKKYPKDGALDSSHLRRSSPIFYATGKRR